MGKLGDKWAQSYVNSRMLFLLVLFVPVGIYFLFFQDKVESTADHTGRVVEIKVVHLGDQPVYTGSVELRDGSRVKVRLFNPVPRQNDIIPITVITYKSGKKEFHINQARWLER